MKTEFGNLDKLLEQSKNVLQTKSRICELTQEINRYSRLCYFTGLTIFANIVLVVLWAFSESILFIVLWAISFILFAGLSINGAVLCIKETGLSRRLLCIITVVFIVPIICFGCLVYPTKIIIFKLELKDIDNKG